MFFSCALLRQSVCGLFLHCKTGLLCHCHGITAHPLVQEKLTMWSNFTRSLNSSEVSPLKRAELCRLYVSPAVSATGHLFFRANYDVVRCFTEARDGGAWKRTDRKIGSGKRAQRRNRKGILPMTKASDYESWYAFLQWRDGWDQLCGCKTKIWTNSYDNYSSECNRPRFVTWY